MCQVAEVGADATMNATETKETLLSTAEAYTFLGVDREYFKKLVDNKIITKIQPVPDVRPRYRKSELEAFMRGEQNKTKTKGKL